MRDLKKMALALVSLLGLFMTPMFVAPVLAKPWEVTVTVTNYWGAPLFDGQGGFYVYLNQTPGGGVSEWCLTDVHGRVRIPLAADAGWSTGLPFTVYVEAGRGHEAGDIGGFLGWTGFYLDKRFSDRISITLPG